MFVYMDGKCTCISTDTSQKVPLCCFRFPPSSSIHIPVFTPVHMYRNCYGLIKINMCMLSFIILLFIRINSWVALDDFTKHKMQSCRFMVVTGLCSTRRNVSSYNIHCPKQRALTVCKLWRSHNDITQPSFFSTYSDYPQFISRD